MATLLCKPFNSRPPSWAPSTINCKKRHTGINFDEFKTKEINGFQLGSCTRLYLCNGAHRNTPPAKFTAGVGRDGSVTELDDNTRKLVQAVLWVAEGIYILWLFLLPYAPTSEGLFNFVIGWTFIFAPLLYTDEKRNRYKGSLDILWGFQMFLTNTFLIPYMAIRLNKVDVKSSPRKTSRLGTIMTNGAPVVGLIGAAVCLISALWALYGRADGNFGSVSERLEFLMSYLDSERLAYAFIWDICLYIIFQPWLIGDNIQNIRKDSVGIVRYLRFVPVVGIVAYCLCLDFNGET